MTRLEITSGEQAGEIFELRPGPNVVGRSESADVQVRDSSVSGAHCLILVTGFSVKARDLSSTNGTFAGGQRVDEIELADQQTLTLGSLELRVHIPPVEISIPQRSAREETGPWHLEDGSPACFRHHETAAVFGCGRCGRTYCGECVHDVHLEGHAPSYFCPGCGGRCGLLAGVEAAPVQASQTESVRNRILDTIRLTFARSGKRR